MGKDAIERLSSNKQEYAEVKIKILKEFDVEGFAEFLGVSQEEFWEDVIYRGISGHKIDIDELPKIVNFEV